MNCIQYLGEFTTLILLIDTESKEELEDAKDLLLQQRLLLPPLLSGEKHPSYGTDGVPEHRCLGYGTLKGKVAILRQLNPFVHFGGFVDFF